MTTIKPGRYRHFKGNEYEVIGTARHSETLEELVVYRALYDNGGLWVRPAAMWSEIVDRDGIDGTGKSAVVVGRSLVVGKPAAMMLLKKNATVTICHTRTKDMPSVVKEADIVIVAAGRAGVVDDTYLRAGQTVIDVGINVNEEGKLCGDVAYAKAEPIVEAITPVPGGVGSVTTSVLVGHVVEAAMRKNS